MKFKLKAFTLIELIIVIAIVSIILSLILLNLRIIDNYEENLEFENFLLDINYCKNASRSSRKRHHIAINFFDNSYYISDKKKKVNLENLEFIEGKSNVDYIEFTEGGKPAFNTAGTIFLYNKESKNIYKISITPVTGKFNASKYEDENI